VVRAGDLRLWLFVGLFLAIVGFLIWATVAAGGF
jgi:hypothetical protein